VATGLLLVPTPSALAQSKGNAPAAPPAKVLDPIRADIKAGRFEAASKALAALPAAEPVLRLRIQAALGLDKPQAAAATYQDLAQLTAKEEPALLRTIATATLRELAREGEPVLGIEACAGLPATPSEACVAAVRKSAVDPKQPASVRFYGLAMLAGRGDRDALRRFQQSARSRYPTEARTVVDAARRLPASLAVPVLSSLLENPERDIQTAAVWNLGEFKTPAAKTALARYLAGPRPIAAGAARVSLALCGDEQQLSALAEELPTMQGADLLAVGSVLHAKGDRRGRTAIMQVAHGEDELLRIRAAALLNGDPAPLVQGVLDRALDSDNIWIRAAALEAFRDSPGLSLARARRFLADPEPWVRLRAAQAVSARTQMAKTGSPAPAVAGARPR
jgi:HEAT repeat protein